MCHHRAHPYINAIEHCGKTVALSLDLTARIRRAGWLYWQIYETRFAKVDYRERFGEDIDRTYSRYLSFLKLLSFLKKAMEVVCREFGVKKESLKARRRKDHARWVMIKLLKERSRMTQREVAVTVGLRDGSGISRHLAEVNEQLNENRTLRRTYKRIVAALNH